MSTKIYDAYRIKKSNIDDIYDVLYNFRETAKEYVRQNEKLLRAVHVGAFYHKMFNAKNKRERRDVIKRFRKGTFIEFEIKQYLEYSENLIERDITATDVKVLISLFKDDDYWYLKFFVNGGHMMKLLRKLEDEYDFLEDYHYQNQSDPPEDIPYEEFEKRGVKWDELTDREGGTYRGGLQYEVFDAYEFHKLMSRFFYTGKELYQDLAYKFPPLEFEEKDDETKVKKK